jgi:hypothetical protein
LFALVLRSHATILDAAGSMSEMAMLRQLCSTGAPAPNFSHGLQKLQTKIQEAI